ncbi:unnamed protein product [Brugia timori]|uniref:Secreted protein n=1 Tax=Brugia timori TaxID=42155 RepID=A0A0R3R3M3_9BILA|nr:unnamed protein product [Brugia timori]
MLFMFRILFIILSTTVFDFCSANENIFSLRIQPTFFFFLSICWDALNRISEKQVIFIKCGKIK